MFRSMFRVPLVLAAVLLAAACGDDTPTTPTPPAPPTTTETFSGSINRNGAVTHPFATALSGEINVVLTTLAADASQRVSLGLGTWNTSFGTCQLILVNDAAVQGSRIVGQATSVGGTFCVRVSDVGTIGDPISYEVSVTHP